MSKKLWDGRFSEETDRSVEAFTASIDIDKRLYAYDIEGSIAHCRMLEKASVITPEEMSQMLEGLGRIQREIEHGDFAFDDSLEDIHMHVEARLVHQVGKPAQKLHTARSRNDQVALDLRLYLQGRDPPDHRGAGRPAAGRRGAGRSQHRRDHAGLHAPAAGPAGPVLPPSDGLLRDVDPGRPALRGRAQAHRRHAPGNRGPGRHHLPHRSALHGGAARFSERFRETASTRCPTGTSSSSFWPRPACA